MKLNHEQYGKGREVESASGLQRSRRSLARARSQLTQAVGDVLSGALEGRRAGGGWLTAFGGLAPAPVPQTADRLREVVIRDRALFAANPRPMRTLAMDDLGVVDLTSEVSDLDEEPIARRADEEALIDDQSALDDPPRDVPPREAAVSARETAKAAVKEPKAKPAAATSKEAAAKPPGREPIRTRTMARLLASQGHRGRALSIYDDLLAKDGSDSSLREEAEALRRQSD
jgi:hypothetical protein